MIRIDGPRKGIERIAVVGTVIFTILVIPCPSRALEMNWNMNLRSLASDNIERVYGDGTTTGTVTALIVGVEVEETLRRGTYMLRGYGGSERVDAENVTSENIYRLETEMDWTFKDGNSVQFLLGTIGETTTFTLENLDHARAFTEQTMSQLTLSKETRKMTRQMILEGERLKREDQDSREINLTLDYSWTVSSTIDITAEGVAFRGREQVSEDEWGGEELTLGFERLTERNTILSGEVFTRSTRIETHATGNRIMLDRLGFRLSRASQISPTWFMRTIAGIEGLDSNNQNMEWDPLFSVHLNVQLNERTEMDYNFAYNLTVSRGQSSIPEWARTLAGAASVSWEPARSFELDAEIGYTRYDFPAEQITAEHVEQQYTGRTRLNWRASDHFTYDLSLSHDRIDNELNQDLLRENVLELTVTATL